MAIREGSLKAAAERLGITPAAVGQRIQTLENYLGTDLLLRGRSGLQPTAELEHALADLRAGFTALGRVIDILDFQRVSEIHIIAEHDWAELWLMPRMQAFREAYPNILFCINGAGDVPLRLGAPDLRITYGEGPGEPLFRDCFLPVTSPDNMRRVADWDPVMQMEGMPLLHLKAQREKEDCPGWVQWFQEFGHRQEGPDRGVYYQNARIALEAVRQDVGFLVCGLSLILDDLETGAIMHPYPASWHIAAPHPYMLHIQNKSGARPQVRKFITWLRETASNTKRQLETVTAPDTAG